MYGDKRIFILVLNCWCESEQVFKTNLFLNPVVCLGERDGNKFLFANENTLVHNAWPASVAKLLGSHSLTTKVGEEHKYASCPAAIIFSIAVTSKVGLFLNVSTEKIDFASPIVEFLSHYSVQSQNPVLVLSFIGKSVITFLHLVPVFKWSSLDPLNLNELSNSNSSSRSSGLCSGSM